jgi:hypothetical protein
MNSIMREVVARNLARRHLSPGERAKVGADLVNTKKHDNQFTTITKIGVPSNGGTSLAKISASLASKMVGCSVTAIERELANRNPNSRRKEKIAKAQPAKSKLAAKKRSEPKGSKPVQRCRGSDRRQRGEAQQALSPRRRG